jgi:cation:H+ antiporter
MPISETILVIIAGIAALIIGANMITESATDIARYFGISERIIGLTLIAFGTSLPELVVCIIAALKREYDMAIGNIVGSNIFNILFVLGIAATIQPLPFSPAFLTDGAIALAAVIMLMIFVAWKSKLSRIGGILFLGSYAMYIWYLF